jgi:hypothetical protein
MDITTGALHGLFDIRSVRHAGTVEYLQNKRPKVRGDGKGPQGIVSLMEKNGHGVEVFF